jgi:hypothetical protein
MLYPLGATVHRLGRPGYQLGGGLYRLGGGTTVVDLDGDGIKVRVAALMA